MASLEHIFSQKTLLVKQKLDIVEEGLGVEKKNQYTIFDVRNQPLAKVVEVSEGVKDFIELHLAGSERNYEMAVKSEGEELFRFKRKNFFFSSQTSIFQKKGETLGSIKKRFHPLFWKYDYINSQGQVFGKGSSPRWTWTVKIKNPRGKLISEIKKKWSGGLQEVLTETDHFSIEFHETGSSLTIPQKAVLFTGVINYDFNRFEDK